MVSGINWKEKWGQKFCVRLKVEQETYFTAGRVESEDELLEFQGSCTVVGTGTAPGRFMDVHPFAAVEEGMGWTERDSRVGSRWGREKGRVFDGVEDVEVGESAGNAEEDNGLDGRIGRVQRKRLQQDTHPGLTELSYQSSTFFSINTQHRF
jgi:hypothetical protein